MINDMESIERKTKSLISKFCDSSGKRCKEKEIKSIVNAILEIEEVKLNQSTPIVRISEHYGLKVYKSNNLKSNVASKMSLNESKKVIIINKKETIYMKRYLIAIELGKYIFDFLSNEKYKSNEPYFHQLEYYENSSNNIEKRFATEILMPEISFLRQYLIAKESNSNVAFTYIYLSKFFEVPESLVRKKIRSFIIDKDI